MIQLTEDEVRAFNVLNNHLRDVKAELQGSMAAVNAYISLLETKYNATFDPTNGKLKPKEKKKEA